MADVEEAVREVEEVEPGNRPVSLWLFRHFTPNQKYREEKPLVYDKAVIEAAEAAEALVRNIESGEPLILYGAGTKGRHLESYQLLKNAIGKEIKKSGKDIKVFEPRVTQRKSLRPVEFRHYRDLPVEAGQEVRYWLETEDTRGGRLESPEAVFDRLRRLVKGVVGFSKRQPGEERAHWVFVTSGEFLAPEFVRQIGFSEILRAGFKPGGWVRVDIPGGEFSGKAKFTHYSGLAEEGDFLRPYTGPEKISPRK